MDHLYPSGVVVERPTITNVNGRARNTYSEVSIPGGGPLKCRLDLQFVRVGDVQPALVAGRAPDRYGIMFCSSSSPIKAGDRIRTVSGPVDGIFEIRTIPDMAVDFASMHHIEVQVWESHRDLDELWPGE
jgi:hypothetical protein